jgi:hypothetical protein
LIFGQELVFVDGVRCPKGITRSTVSTISFSDPYPLWLQPKPSVPCSYWRNYQNSNVDFPHILVLIRSYPASPPHTRAQSVKRALDLQISCILLSSFLHTLLARFYVYCVFTFPASAYEGSIPALDENKLCFTRSPVLAIKSLSMGGSESIYKVRVGTDSSTGRIGVRIGLYRSIGAG